MSFFSKIDSMAHTFVSWAEKQLAVIYQKAPAIEQVIAAFLKYGGSALQLVAAAEAGPGAAAAVGVGIADAQAGLTAASGLIYDYGANPTTVSVIDSVATNLNGLLAAGHIKNQQSIDTITKIVTQAKGIVDAVNGGQTTQPTTAPAA